MMVTLRQTIVMTPEPLYNPAATEIPNNSIDENCDGIIIEGGIDADNDGYLAENDCDDSEETGAPINPETVWYKDEDGDGYGAIDSDIIQCEKPSELYVLEGSDCDDSKDYIHPGAFDYAKNNIDDDCDGSDLQGTDNDGDGFIAAPRL